MEEDTEWALQGKGKNDNLVKKTKLTQLLNIVTGKDKNWDGSVDIKDKLIEAEQKVKMEAKLLKNGKFVVVEKDGHTDAASVVRMCKTIQSHAQMIIDHLTNSRS